jgi:hypothetical protein
MAASRTRFSAALRGRFALVMTVDAGGESLRQPFTQSW